MSTEIDTQSLDLLHSMRGTSIDWVAGVPYPGVAGYSEVRLGNAAGATLSFTLRVADVDDELEVCVPVVQRAQPFETAEGTHVIQIGGFHLASVYKLQRRESIEPLARASGGYQGGNPREHVLAEINDGDSPGAHIVDAGVALASENGIVLELYADSFPLVFQLRLVVASSVVPQPRRIKLF